MQTPNTNIWVLTKEVDVHAPPISENVKNHNALDLII